MSKKIISHKIKTRNIMCTQMKINNRSKVMSKI